MNRILCIDPGLSDGDGGTGWALFEQNKLFPKKWGVAKTKVHGPEEMWPLKSTSIIDQLRWTVGSWGDSFIQPAACAHIADTVYIELPTFFQTVKGHMCATGREGQDSSLVKLSIHIGRIYELFHHMRWNVEFIRVNDWKGTMKPNAVAARVGDRLKSQLVASANSKATNGKYTAPSLAAGVFGDHALDAVGMGLHVKGVFAPNVIKKEEPKTIRARARVARAGSSRGVTKRTK